jgi:hypothetical protein
METFVQLREAQRNAGEKEKQLKAAAEELELKELAIAELQARLAEMTEKRHEAMLQL